MTTRERRLESQRRSRARNPIPHREGSKRWATENPERAAAIKRRWYEKNKRRVIAAAKARAEAHPEVVAQYKETWRKANLPSTRELKRRRRARIRGAGEWGPTITVKEWESLKSVHDHSCAYCGSKPSRLEQDHIVPVARGGGHTLENIVPACRRCNSRKSSKTALEFLLYVA